ncbi:polysaccharide deacetylase family protein [Nonomuraea sp. NPDC059194]|uniref:polysaccharide deacetylase family protein n=1 Tax=Nonomuraea sp. NPDC059194 TaxID=3346764 RepID=UPI003695F38B
MNRLTIFGWHNVESTWCFPVPAARGARGLERQLRWLRRTAQVVPLEWALDRLHAGDPLPARAVALCWDDGYRDNLDLAVPILERLGLPGTFFLVPELLSRRTRAWWEVLGWAFERSTKDSFGWRSSIYTTGRADYVRVSDELRAMDERARQEAVPELVKALAPEGEPGDVEMFMDWAAAKELVARGFDVGSHSLRHAALAQETPEEQVADLATARSVLQDGLGVEINVVAYPYGQPDTVSGETESAARKAGYAHGLTTEAGLNSRSTCATAGHRIMLDPHRTFTGSAVERVAGKLRKVVAR